MIQTHTQNIKKNKRNTKLTCIHTDKHKKNYFRTLSTHTHTHTHCRRIGKDNHRQTHDTNIEQFSYIKKKKERKVYSPSPCMFVSTIFRLFFCIVSLFDIFPETRFISRWKRCYPGSSLVIIWNKKTSMPDSCILRRFLVV